MNGSVTIIGKRSKENLFVTELIIKKPNKRNDVLIENFDENDEETDEDFDNDEKANKREDICIIENKSKPLSHGKS
jgi:hypothetical protein